MLNRGDGGSQGQKIPQAFDLGDSCLFDVGKLVFAALDKAWLGNGRIFGDFDAVY